MLFEKDGLLAEIKESDFDVSCLDVTHQMLSWKG